MCSRTPRICQVRKCPERPTRAGRQLRSVGTGGSDPNPPFVVHRRCGCASTSEKPILPIVLYTEQPAYEHARIWAELEASRKMIGSYDLIVAATALERGSQVVIFNKRHFARIHGLSVIEPTGDS